jgi:DNA-binding XRE family transcriptional regulator
MLVADSIESSPWTYRLGADTVPRMGPPAAPQPALGKAIRELRTKSEISQEDLAHAAGVTTSTLSSIERGRSNPTWATVKAIAAALGISMEALASRVDKLEAP